MTKVIKGFKPHPKQKEIIEEVLGGESKFNIVSVGRQFGKSLMGINLALYWGFNNNPCKILWVSPVYSQANKVQKEIHKAVNPSGLIKTCNFSENFIELANGTEIIFRSAERYDNIRGYTFDYGILDEAAFMKSEAYYEAIRPTLAVKGKKVLFLSTPKGKNWFYDLYNIGLEDDNTNYRSFRGSSYDTPFISEEEINDAKKTLPESIFKQEYLAEFLDGGGEVFNNIDVNTFKQYSTPQGKVFCGIDLGRLEDFTVATFMDSEGKVIDVYRRNNIDWGTMVNDLVSKLKEYDAVGLIEVNSIGDVIYEQIKKKYRNIHPFVTTNKTKQELIEGLILDFNESNIQIPSRELFNPLYDELSYFTYDYNPKTRSIKYGHPTGLHDDCVISLALSNYCKKTKVKLGSYSWIK